MITQKELTEQELAELKKMVADAKQKIAKMTQEEIDQDIMNDDHCCAGETIQVEDV